MALFYVYLAGFILTLIPLLMVARAKQVANRLELDRGTRRLYVELEGGHRPAFVDYVVAVAISAVWFFAAPIMSWLGWYVSRQ